MCIQTGVEYSRDEIDVRPTEAFVLWAFSLSPPCIYHSVWETVVTVKCEFALGAEVLTD